MYFAVFAHAEGQTDYSTSGGKNYGAGVDLSQKKSMNQSHSDSRSNTYSRTGSDEEQVSASLKAMHNAQRSRELDLTKPAQTLFLDYLLELETTEGMLNNVPQQNLVKYVLKQPLSVPLLPSHIGFDTEIEGTSMIDGTKAEYLSHAAKTNALISKFADEDVVRGYIDTLAVYGAIVGQAYINLNDSVSKLDTALKTNGRKGRITKGVRDIQIESVGAADFDILARAALYKVFQTGITDASIKRTLNRILANNKPCRLYQDITTVVCGEIRLNLNNPGELAIAGVTWAGSAFAGYQGNYKVASSWSYAETLDKLQSVSQSSRIANEYAKRSEDAESLGNGVDAVLSRKTGVDASSKASNSVKPVWKQ